VVVRTVTRQLPNRAHLQHALLAGLCALAACTPNSGLKTPYAATGFCVKPTDICTPDPGAPPVDCAAAEKGIEFFPYSIADFEKQNGDGVNVGQFMYSYTDGTAQVYANHYGMKDPVGYEPKSTSANVCTSDTQNHVLHVTGGHVDSNGQIIGAPFLSWGGGLGVAMAHLTATPPSGLGACPWGHIPQPDYCPPSDADEAVATTTLDLSQWDGVAVWARRAPDSQPLLRVLVGNKYVDEDISFLEYSADASKPRYCERVRECDCQNAKACNWWNTGNSGLYQSGYYCGDPAADPPPMTISGAGVQATNSCDHTQCDQPYPAYADMNQDPNRPTPLSGGTGLQLPPQSTGTDMQYYKRPCTPYAFRSGSQGSYCWDPDPNHRYSIRYTGVLDPNGIPDSPPAESDQQCGDYWTFPLHLTTEWQLYLVPFTTMYQQGWAKRWSFFDTASVSVVRLTWDKGWVDYWIDNLRFYRVRR